MTAAELGTLIPIGAAAIVSIIMAFRARNTANSTDARLTEHINTVSKSVPSAESTFQERTGTSE